MEHSDTSGYEFWLSEAPLTDSPRQEIVNAEEEVTLLELLDRLLTKGVVLSGDLTLSIAEVDLLYVGLRLMITTADKAVEVGAVKLRNGRLA
ncbi:MAG: gas vesicle protein [Chloroflexota bacterium]|nr:gas vesicle protein [Chloroflexota bacterium]